jgi:hypothetical protein
VARQQAEATEFQSLQHENKRLQEENDSAESLGTVGGKAMIARLVMISTADGNQHIVVEASFREAR